MSCNQSRRPSIPLGLASFQIGTYRRQQGMLPTRQNDRLVSMWRCRYCSYTLRSPIRRRNIHPNLQILGRLRTTTLAEKVEVVAEKVEVVAEKVELVAEKVEVVAVQLCSSWCTSSRPTRTFDLLLQSSL
eukprot:COSAG02_NODE_13157_length_1436_cov_2.418100_2_plen_130_part_00